MKSTIKLFLVFLTTLTCTTYTVKQKNVYREGRYRKQAEAYMDKNSLVPNHIIKELNASSREKAKRHNNSVMSEKSFRRWMNK